MGGPVKQFSGGGQSWTTSWDEETKYYINIIQNAGLQAKMELEAYFGKNIMSGYKWHDGVVGDSNIVAMGKKYESEAAAKTIDLQKLASVATASAAPAAPARKMVNIQFTAPGAEPVAGQYLEMDLEKLLQTLKSAGLRSNIV